MKLPTRRPRHILAAAFLLVPTALPQSRTPNAPPPIPRGKLEIRLLVTAEPEKVFHPAKGADGKFAQAEPIKVAPRGKLIAGVIFLKNCQPDTTGNCNVDVDLHGVDPRGSVFENRKGAALWRNVKAPAAGFTQLGSSYMKLQIEPADPAGVWRVTAVAHDRNSGAEARSEASFEVK
jgi:hypothetical protein